MWIGQPKLVKRKFVEKNWRKIYRNKKKWWLRKNIYSLGKFKNWGRLI